VPKMTHGFFAGTKPVSDWIFLSIPPGAQVGGGVGSRHLLTAGRVAYPSFRGRSSRAGGRRRGGGSGEGDDGEEGAGKETTGRRQWGDDFCSAPHVLADTALK
jgi:hypothetical protein